MEQYIQVAEHENEEAIELPTESDGCLLLATLAAQFPDACGLKFRSSSGAMRGLRVLDGRIQSPEGVWADSVYITVFPKGIVGQGT